MRRFVLAIALWLVLPVPVQAQDLVSRLQRARLVRIAQEAIERGDVPMQARSTDSFGTLGDSIRASIYASRAPDYKPSKPSIPNFTVDSVQVLTEADWSTFDSTSRRLDWAFVRGRALTELDTLRTSAIRARLQHVLGDPTRTLVELDSVETLPREAVIQFEYWLVVNDSIPIVLIDVNGPLERGLVLATRRRPQAELAAMHAGLRAYLFKGTERGAYVDYYYRVDSRDWRVSGFDGASFFDRRIERPDFSTGRPMLKTYVPPPSNR